MGSAFYTFAEAANRLKRTTRTVHNYIKRGFLRREVYNGEAVVNREDVDRLAEDAGIDLPSMNRKSFIEMQNRLRKVEEQMRTVMHMLQLRDDRLRPSPEHAGKFYKAAVDSATRAGKWALGEVVQWSTQFEKMDEVFIEQVCDSVKNNGAYAQFMWLNLKMMEYAYDKNAEKPDIEWQAVHKKLQASYASLRSSAIIWIEMGRGGKNDMVFETVDDPKNALYRGLQAHAGKKP